MSGWCPTSSDGSRITSPPQSTIEPPLPSIVQPLAWLPRLARLGETANRVRLAESQVSAARETLRVMEELVLLSAATAYMDVSRDTANLEVQQNKVRVLQRTFKDTRNRFEAGQVTTTPTSLSRRPPVAQCGALRARPSFCSPSAAWRRSADAHQVNISTARVEVRPQCLVAVELALKGSDVDQRCGTLNRSSHSRDEARHSRGPRRFRPVGGDEAVEPDQHRDDATFSTASKPLDPYRPRRNSEAGQLLVHVIGTMRVLRHDEFSKGSVAPAAQHSRGEGAGRDCCLGQRPKTAARATAWRKDLLHSPLP